MSLTGKQSPLGINLQGSILANTGFRINKLAESFMGSSKTNDHYVFGKIVQDTVLRLQTLGINDAYVRNLVSKTSTLDIYDNLINIGSASIPALGNSKPPAYLVTDPSGIWNDTAVKYGEQKSVTPTLPGPATSGYALTSNINQGQQATWYPYTGHSGTNPNTSVTQWGYVRLHALQAWNEFNWNGEEVDWSSPEYKEFLSSFLTAQSFITYSNQAIIAMNNSKTFLEGVYSNMNDLISADISGVSLSSQDWGNDLVNLGTVINLSEIETFGLPSSLLRNLTRYGALTEELLLALLSSGLDGNEITGIINQEIVPTVGQEQKIYGSFLVIVGDNLRNILALMKCSTLGLISLADLLSVKKIFPNSYQTLTVPMYNISSGPTNSKTYYLIFNNGGLNSSLTLFEVPNSYSPSNELTNPIEDPANIKTADNTLGSYLFNIIATDDAIAAGAFSYSMMQIRNIKYCEFENFAQVVRSNETISGLNLVNGTNKPTDEQMSNQGLELTALGSGIHGSYTMSDLFGNMSGLPYQWELIFNYITLLQTTTLQNIYRENFLAITWEAAAVTVQYSTSTVEDPPGIFTDYYTVTGVTLTNDGGGYGRGGAPAPIITISGGSGATAICTIGTNDLNAGSNGSGTFGRVTSVTLTFAGSSSLTIPTITIECPPTTVSGTNTTAGTSGWPTLNTVVQNYIDQANAEIAAIQTANPIDSRKLNTYWNICGGQLAREQRARYIAISPVEIMEPDSSSVVRKDYFANPYPGTQLAFVDLVPELAQDTRPHMAAQSLEAMADLCGVGGQSLIALMRESRNNIRLQQVGITLDNTIPDAMSDAQTIQITTNGTIKNPVNGVQGDNCSYSLPSWANTQDCNTGEIVYPIPSGVYVDDTFRKTNQTVLGSIDPILFNQCGDVSVGTVVPVGAESGPTVSEPYIIAVPNQVNPIIPANLDSDYTSSTLLPSSPNTQEAIDRIIECNCDCWIN